MRAFFILPYCSIFLFMEYLVKDEPSILIDKQTGKGYPFSAEEEVFVIIDNDAKSMISFDFEKRKLSARCIIRVIDYERVKVSEVNAITPKFKIKSTFAQKPFGDSDITFLGGGFTASAVSRNGTIGIIASAPEISLPNGDKGLKIEAYLAADKQSKSFNYLLSHNNNSESLHASITKEIHGTIWIGEKKLEIKENTLQGRHIWKRTSFPKRKEKPVAIIYGKMEDEPFSSIILSYDNSLTLFTEESIKRFDKIQWIVEENNTIRITDQRNIDIKASIFSSVHEKQGPLRKARSFRYALFSGSILNKTIMESVGYLEYPDRL